MSHATIEHLGIMFLVPAALAYAIVFVRLHRHRAFFSLFLDRLSASEEAPSSYVVSELPGGRRLHQIDGRVAGDPYEFRAWANSHGFFTGFELEYAGQNRRFWSSNLEADHRIYAATSANLLINLYHAQGAQLSATL